MINLPHKISEDETNPTLNGMLKTLFSPELSKETIMNRLEKIYHIPKNEKLEGVIHTMCNFGEAILERGIEQGIEQGIRAMIKTCKKFGKSEDEIKEALQEEFQLTTKQAEEYIKKYKA